jgi:cytochrome c oxidase assembly protein subunit 15
MTTITQRKTLAWFSWLTAAGIVILIFLGAMVTTKDAGLAVPDWPLSFGSLNPDGWWMVESVRLEHGHRLVGALVGILIIICTVWTFKLFPNSRGTTGSTRFQRLPRLLAVAALVGVIVQGIMGGLRVTEVSLTLAIIHGIFGQFVLCNVVLLAMVVSPPESRRYQALRQERDLKGPRHLSLVLLVLVPLQLGVAAVMRHLKYGMAIPDFPLSNGAIIPALDSFGVAINFIHRALALVIFIAAALALFYAVKKAAGLRPVTRPTFLLFFLVCVQIALGAFTVWSIRAPVPTTFHVVNGALVLVASVMLAYRTRTSGHPQLSPAQDNSVNRDKQSEQSGELSGAAAS